MTATATAVVDLGFGDAGKGSMVDALARRRRAGGVVRFNGGCQAAHNVTDDDYQVGGELREHTFSQFGAGTFAGALTHLSRFMMVEPISLFVEAQHLVDVGVSDPVSLLTVDPRALVTTPLHKLANQEKERRRRDNPHGSCGRGIGETVEFMLQRPLEAPRVHDLWNIDILAEKIQRLDDYYQRQGMKLDLGWISNFEQAAERFADEITTIHDRDVLQMWHAEMEHVIFEGAQGVLIDEKYGFAPYHTWSNCTFDNAMALAAEAGFTRDKISKMGVTRAYMVRHGAGPMPTENKDLTRLLTDEWNVTNDWQGGFRVGYLDVPLLRYAVDRCGGIDELAVTCMDRVADLSTLTARSVARISMGRFDMDPIVVTADTGPKVCVGYQHSDWGLFDMPANSLPLCRGASATEILAEIEPVYEAWPLDFPAWISEQLGAPVTVLSYGPTAKGKSWLLNDSTGWTGPDAVLPRRA